MIKYLKQEEIDYNKWDACIDKSINSYVYAYSWYLDIVAGDWDALVEDDYKSVFPLPFRKKFGIKYIYQPAFSQQLGLFTTTLLGNDKLQKFLDAIPKEFKLIEVNLNKSNIPTQKANIKLKKNRNIELDLIPNYEILYSKYATNLKRNIKKAHKNHLSIIQNTKPEQLIDLFRENRGKDISAYSDLDYTHLGRLAYLLIHKGLGQIWGVISEENNLLAAALFVQSKDRYIFLFSGLSEEGKQKAAMPFLMDSFIKKHSETKSILDFEGSNDHNLARFYKSFGSLELYYYGIQIIQGGILFKSLLKIKG
ncbi:MAG: hypothetical protein DSY76_05555 [Bacteroidetes bacterium]|nr:MAG: hypothetical protein DSY76_05555 [Bacteroidota bacterium]